MKKIATHTGFPKNKTRLPSVEELNFLGNLFFWLNEHRGVDLPLLDSPPIFEWVENYILVDDFDVGTYFLALGGLTSLTGRYLYDEDDMIGFRVLCEL